MTDVHAALVHDIYVAEEELSKTEASLRIVEARLSMADAAMARVRQVGARLGMRMSHRLAVPRSNSTRTNISMKEMVERTGVCERTCSKIRKAMTEGIHFHKVGSRVLFTIPKPSSSWRSGPCGHRRLRSSRPSTTTCSGDEPELHWRG